MVTLSQVKLLELSAYSPQQIENLRRVSSAFDHYLRMQDQKPETVSDRLRFKRQIAWLKAVAASVYETATPFEICFFWSDVADRVLLEAWTEAGLHDSEAALFALGKLGAQELNLSSDVDLLVIASPDALADTDKKLRVFRKLLTEVTQFGFCFRLDFDLRPGGQSHSTVVTPAQFQEHYWSRGEAWEKMALVRLRGLTGDKEIQETIHEHAKRFSYRKYLDFTLLDDLKQVRARIHHEGFEARPDEIHLKLGRGGIRDIELFVNAIQVLHGGKISKLQTNSTAHAFTQIQDLEILPETEVDLLQTTYWRFRQWENLTQALADRQTHYIAWPCPWEEDGWPPKHDVADEMQKIDTLVATLLGTADTASEELPADTDQATWLRTLGFAELSIQEVWPKVMAASALSQKTDRDERARRRFLYRMVMELSQSPNDKDLGLTLLQDFIRAIRAKAAFFSLLNREPRLIADLARLFSFSPYLSSLFTARPELIDNFVLNIDEPFSADFETMLDEMAGRKFLSEVMAAMRFLSDFQVTNMADALTYTADHVTTHLLDRLVKDFEAQPMNLLALGKWGSRELGLKSDLDFIFVCDQPATEKEQKVAKRFISRLTDPHRGGSLYEIDLRLRPSGKAGPILTSREKLQEYLEGASDVWERQAYTRARLVRTDEPFALKNVVKRALAKEDVAKLAEIRLKLLKPVEAGKIDLKYAPGGLVDVEFAAQISLLQFHVEPVSGSTSSMINSLGEHGWGTSAESLKANYNRLRELEQLLTLAGSIKSAEFRVHHDTAIRCAQLLKKDVHELETELLHILEQNQNLLLKLDPRQNSVSL
jgi:glutamate-ammonia-ligase adenylyltransferase